MIKLYCNDSYAFKCNKKCDENLTMEKPVAGSLCL